MMKRVCQHWRVFGSFIGLYTTSPNVSLGIPINSVGLAEHLGIERMGQNYNQLLSYYTWFLKAPGFRTI